MKFDYKNIYTHPRFGTVHQLTGLLGTSGEVSVMKINGESLRARPEDLRVLNENVKREMFIFDALGIYACSMSNVDKKTLSIYILMNSKDFNVMDVADQLKLKEDVEAEILKDSFN